MVKEMSRAVFPVPPIYDNGHFSFAKTEKYLDYLKECGVIRIMITAGTSQLDYLSENDFIAFVKLCSQKGFKEFILGLESKPLNYLLETIGYLDNILKIKNTSYLILYPGRYYNDHEVIRFFREVAQKSQKPIMAHLMPIRSGRGMHYEDYTPYIMKQLSSMPNVLGVKEESTTLDKGIAICKDNGHVNFDIIVAGGSQKRFNVLEPWGATSFLAGAGSLIPKLDLEENMQAEIDCFDISKSMGWHKFMRWGISYLLFGGEDINRAPFPFPTMQEKQLILDFLKKYND